MDAERSVVPAERIEKVILLLRGQKVMLSRDLASLYGVEPKVLVQAVKRNARRFPPDFMFQLTAREFAGLKSQFVTSSWGGMRRASLRQTLGYCGQVQPAQNAQRVWQGSRKGREPQTQASLCVSRWAASTIVPPRPIFRVEDISATIS